MKCQRCQDEREAEYHVSSTILELDVCAPCAEQAEKLGLRVEPLVEHQPLPV